MKQQIQITFLKENCEHNLHNVRNNIQYGANPQILDYIANGSLRSIKNHFPQEKYTTSKLLAVLQQGSPLSAHLKIAHQISFKKQKPNTLHESHL